MPDGSAAGLALLAVALLLRRRSGAVVAPAPLRRPRRRRPRPHRARRRQRGNPRGTRSGVAWVPDEGGACGGEGAPRDPPRARRRGGAHRSGRRRPTLALPSPITAEATGPDGAAVGFTATASNPTGKALPVTCTPASGSTFPLGTTTVTCSVVDDDASGASGTFTVTVVDTTAPTIAGSPSASVDAAGPDGAVATYALPTASDTVDGAVPVSCAPASGTTFPVGTTVVTCTARDRAGNTATSTGTVAVIDRVPPTLTAPARLSALRRPPPGSPRPTRASRHSSRRRRRPMRSRPRQRHERRSRRPPGRDDDVRFTAADASGNSVSLTSTITVTPLPPAATSPGTPPTLPSAPPLTTPPAGAGAADRIPPGDVTAVRARRVVSGAISITWRAPTDADFAFVRIYRAGASDAAAAPVVVYEGTATSFDDRRLRNGVVYRYVIASVDAAGNRSRGVAFDVRPQALRLWAPLDGARVAVSPLFVWAPVRSASYYNVQVFRGTRKVFSAWPTTNRLRMPASWRFGGRRERLTPGTYRWYVWPGFGARARTRYGAALGTSTFTVVAR